MAAGMRWGTVQQRDIHALDLLGLFVLGLRLRGEPVGRRSSAATGAESGFHFFLLVLVPDDRDPVREGDGAVHVIAVAVSENQVCDRLGRELGNLLYDLFARIRRGFRIDHNDTTLADDDAGISAAAFDPIYRTLFQRMNRKLLGLRRLLRKPDTEVLRIGEWINQEEHFGRVAGAQAIQDSSEVAR